MKKNIKGRLFLFIITAIVFSSVSVIATSTYYANQIVYGNTTVEGALNNLYSTASASSYTPSGHVTPGNQEQTLETENKRVTSNIVIDPIPSNYKDINESTVSQASDVLKGKKTYTSSGQLVTGTRAECVYSSINKSANSNITLNLGFKPTSFMFSYTIDQVIAYISYNNSQGKVLISNFNSSASTSSVIEITSYFNITNSGITTNLNTTGTLYVNAATVYYMACK